MLTLLFEVLCVVLDHSHGHYRGLIPTGFIPTTSVFMCPLVQHLKLLVYINGIRLVTRYPGIMNEASTLTHLSHFLFNTVATHSGI